MKKGVCNTCGVYRYLQRDHIKPRWDGGGEEASNIQLICYDCHVDKTAADYKDGAPHFGWSKLTPEQRLKGARLGNATSKLRYTTEQIAASAQHARSCRKKSG